MSFLQSIDGNKTYICAIAAGIMTTIHFIVVGDFSIAAFSQFVQSEAIVGAVAALRHGISKNQPAPNGGVLPGGTQQGG